MIVIMRRALFRTPLTNICTQLTDRIGKATLAHHGLCAQQTDVDALAAAVGTIVVAIQIDHRIQACFAGNRTALASFDAFSISTHRSFSNQIG